ncbi:AAA family ATPase [Thioclava sp. GXIMD4216]|uniref:AAA family ATPase n=1 Tax=Thioclava sp. GXIMD4216 TaxID=3131929 RepID=UPI0030D2FBC2
MLTFVEIRSEASFSDTGVRLDDLGPCNVIFGPNGSGKSTISRVLADLKSYPSCANGWASGPKEVIVFSRDYIARNCHPSQAMPGIYTLGGDADAAREVEKKEGTRDHERKRLNSAIERLRAQDGEPALNAENATFSRNIWNLRRETWTQYKSLTFAGTWSAEARFASEYYTRAEQWNGEDPPPLTELLGQAQIFSDTPPTVAERLPRPPNLANKEPIQDRLRKPLLPASDQPIAELVAELGCADWVKAGLPLLQQSSGRCPFCQQKVDHSLSTRIAAIFDATYESGIEAIRCERDIYTKDIEAIAKWIGEVAGSPLLDVDAGKAFSTWIEIHRRNLEAIDRKLSAPSSTIDLEADIDAFSMVLSFIDAANVKADHQTNLSKNFVRERSAWQENIWCRFLSDTRSDYAGHVARRQPLLKKINGLGDTIKQCEATVAKLDGEIAELRRGISGIEATAAAINNLLRLQGHASFHLRPTSGDGTYSVHRADGSPTGDTLSEGERSFLAFVYLYYHLAGDHNDAEQNTGRVVVIDDPMTSQDAAAVHTVAAMVRKLFEDACTSGGRISQVIVLTHNAHFHHEISSYWKGKAPDPKHWILRKPAGVSSVTSHGTNTPIMTAYRALWDEVNDPATVPVALCNAMRRILEHYFKFIGDRDWISGLDNLDGADAFAFGALRRSLNDGSHGYLGAEEFYFDADAGERLRSVFRRVFEFHGQRSHYEMMCGDSNLLAPDI